MTDTAPADIEAPRSSRVTVFNLPDTEDAKDFEALHAFVAGTQHDLAPANWDGSRRREGVPYYRERYAHRALVPLDAGSPWTRKPDVVTPIAREIVGLFTAALIDVQIHVPLDANTESYFGKVWSHGKYQAAFAAARDMAGAARAACLVPSIIGGRPVLEVIKPSEMRVLDWSTSEVCQPRRVIRQRLVCKEVPNKLGDLETREFWRTCEWDETSFYEYQDVPKDYDSRKDIPLAKDPIPHGCDGRCPVTWYRNTMTSSDCKWGVHDYHQLEGRCDAIDQLGAQLRGSVGNNVDPTLFQFDEEGSRRRHLITRKGRGVLVQGSEKAKAGFLQLDAEGIRVGIEYFDKLIEETMALAGCVRIPASMAGKLSGRAIKLLWKPTQNKVARLAPEFIDTIVRVLECNYQMAQFFGVSSIENPVPCTIILPSRVISVAPPHNTPEEQAEGAAEAPGTLLMEQEKRFEVAEPGAFGSIEVAIGEYFGPVAEERAAELTALQGVSGGGAILSRKTAIERAATIIDVDPVEECRRVAEEEEEAMAHQLEIAKQTAAIDATAGATEGEDEDPEDEPVREDEAPEDDEG